MVVANDLGRRCASERSMTDLANSAPPEAGSLPTGSPPRSAHSSLGREEWGCIPYTSSRRGYDAPQLPAYFCLILGVWKVLGAVAVLVPRFPRLKEWAYAGAVFELTGASRLSSRGRS